MSEWLYYVDDVGRVLAPVLIMFFAVRFSFTTQWWKTWTFRAFFLLIWTSAVTKLLLAAATAITSPRTTEITVKAQLLNASFWWLWVLVVSFLIVSYEMDRRRAHVAARSRAETGDSR